MSETVARHRPSIDLDDFERRLDAQTHRHGQEDDPLAELARIVGEQHDPYGDVFARQPVAAAHDDFRPSFEPHGRQEPPLGRQEPSLGRERPRLSADFSAIEAGLRGAGMASALQAHAAPQPQHYDAPAPDYGYAPEQDQYAPHEQQYAAPEQHAWEDTARVPASSGSRRPVYVMAASIMIAVVGIGVAFAYKGTGSSPREIKTIMAASGPTKIQPPADAASDQADPDAGATGQQAPTKLVSREEQPVDLSQAVQDNAARDAASRGTDAASVPVPLSPNQAAGAASPDYSTLGGAPADASSTGSTNPSYGDQGFGVGMPKPKRVKSVSVRPDGSIVGGEGAAPAAPADDMINKLAGTAPVKSSDRAGPVSGIATPAASSPKSTRASRSTARVAMAAPKPADDNADAADAAAPAPAKPASKAKPVKVASAETGTQDNTAGEAKAAGAGSWAVQLAAPGSEADARSATSHLLKKYGRALSGRRLGFHKADSNGHTVYRVRVSSLTKEDAASLCGKLKADGGSCFIAKN